MVIFTFFQFFLCFFVSNAQNLRVFRANTTYGLELHWNGLQNLNNDMVFIVQYSQHGNGRLWENETVPFPENRDGTLIFHFREPYPCSRYLVQVVAITENTFAHSDTVTIQKPILEMPFDKSVSVKSITFDPNDQWTGFGSSIPHGSVILTLEYTPPYRMVPNIDHGAFPWDPSDLDIEMAALVSRCSVPDFRPFPMPTYTVDIARPLIAVRVHRLAMTRRCHLVLMLEKISSKLCGPSSAVDIPGFLTQKLDCETVANSGCTTKKKVPSPFCSVKNVQAKLLNNGSVKVSWEPNSSSKRMQRFGAPEYFAVRVGIAQPLPPLPLFGNSLVRMTKSLKILRTCQPNHLSSCDKSKKSVTIDFLRPGPLYGVQICAVYSPNQEFPALHIQHLLTYKLKF